jgi:hypothetical protein
MKFLVTSDIPTLVRDALLAEWQPVVGTSECDELVQLSMEPPSFIQIAGETLAWVTPLKAAAAAFLGPFLAELGKRSAAAVWNKGTTTLRRLASSLSRARANSPRRPAIGLGLSLPGGEAHAVFGIAPDSEVEAARAIAYFVLCAEPIEELLRAELAAGRMQDDATVQIALQDDGSFIVRWLDESSGADLERRVPPPKLP